MWLVEEIILEIDFNQKKKIQENDKLFIKIMNEYITYLSFFFFLYITV